MFLTQCPEVYFVRDQFSGALSTLLPASLDCVYSISVLEHIPLDALAAIAAGVKKFLKPKEFHLHAVDHVAHLLNLKYLVELFGFSVKKLDGTLENVDYDTETYFLSAESHNSRRGSAALSRVSDESLYQRSASGPRRFGFPTVI